ncbi:MAG: Gfo/Idh/MocA family protein [Acetanaerobacterium sp.]
MIKLFRTGIVGAGFIGAAHIENLRRLGTVQIAALCDSTGAEQKAAALCIPAFYTDYKQMIDHEQLDAVHICTPNNTHYEIARYALEHGVNVLCEKPLTTNTAEAEELLALAAKKGLRHGVNFHNRFYPMVHEMKEMVGRAELGRILSVHGEYVQDWLLYDTDYSWRLEPRVSGDSRAVADIGSHWLDTVETITGYRITRVFANFATFHPTRKKPLKAVQTYSGASPSPDEYEDVPITTEDYAQILFYLENGAPGNLTVSQMFAGKRNDMRIAIAGDKQALEWNSDRLNELWIGRRGGFNEVAVKDPAILSPTTSGMISYPGGHSEGFPDAFKQGFSQFYRSIEDKTGTYDYATFASGLREMRLCEAIVASARGDRWVDII